MGKSFAPEKKEILGPWPVSKIRQTPYCSFYFQFFFYLPSMDSTSLALSALPGLSIQVLQRALICI
jgi:hypothetical protein